jgi:uncharacterized membrane protein YciS (DUF1049 family)
MRFLKWGIVFLVAFTIAWVLIFTFSQEPFSAKVAIRLPGLKTPQFPIYGFVAAAFLSGLLIGVLISIYNYVIYKVDIRKKSKRIHELEQMTSQKEPVISSGANYEDVSQKNHLGHLND